MTFSFETKAAERVSLAAFYLRAMREGWVDTDLERDERRF
jgi:hypothetical protein